ncbi:NADPH-dependent FMN reductase [Streptosporangium canum]|uniref:NADPH-dependent FMN reductase n=1 Tax=Streptosporangium canum TaxID=324952 RepID=UPI0036D1690E
MIKVAVVIGSTRPGRNGEGVARWVHDLATRRDDAVFEIVDLRDYDLPHLDEPMPPAMGQYEHPHTMAWAEKIASFDAYVFVTPEYNRSISGALKNAIDFLHAEWANKAAGFVGYGSVGGTRAVEHLRLVLGELQVAVVSSQVALTLAADFEHFSVARPAAHQAGRLTAMLDQLIPWAGAMKALRSDAVPSS